MFEHVLGYVIGKGFYIGSIAGALHVLKAWRDSTFTLKIAITDMVGSTLVGAMMWSVLGGTELSEITKVVVTLIAAIDVFIILAVLTDPSFIKRTILHILRVGDTKDADKSGKD